MGFAKDGVYWDSLKLKRKDMGLIRTVDQAGWKEFGDGNKISQQTVMNPVYQANDPPYRNVPQTAI